MASYSGFSHWTWWFSIAMLVYQRVSTVGCSQVSQGSVMKDFHLALGHDAMASTTNEARFSRAKPKTSWALPNAGDDMMNLMLWKSYWAGGYRPPKTIVYHFFIKFWWIWSDFWWSLMDVWWRCWWMSLILGDFWWCLKKQIMDVFSTW